MKHIFSLALALVFLLALAPAVSADVIVSPVEIILDILDIRTVLIATGLVAAGSALFLWITRRKK
jgi:ABC-type Na+ efflux pump permease subunit